MFMFKTTIDNREAFIPNTTIDLVHKKGDSYTIHRKDGVVCPMDDVTKEDHAMVKKHFVEFKEHASGEVYFIHPERILSLFNDMGTIGVEFTMARACYKIKSRFDYDKQNIFRLSYLLASHRLDDDIDAKLYAKLGGVES